MTRKWVRKAVCAYVREHMMVLAGYSVLAICFYLVAGLYGDVHAMKNMFYALILALFLGICIGVWDCACKIRHLGKLADAGSREGEREAYLPPARTLVERYYQEMIHELEEERRRYQSAYDEKEKDMADYYTMWTHQIKTPIAALRLLLQEEENLYTRQEQEELFKIEQYAKMALQYARLHSLSSDLLLKHYNIYEIAKQAVRSYSILFIGSGLSFSMEECICHAVTDEKWLSFVIEQLLSNALKYTKSGSIRIYGQDQNGQKTNGEACALIIEDTGIGIQESDLPRIFERGFTGYNGRFDKKATGLGLYLCRQILEKLGHTITVESQMDVGTKVTLGFVTKM